MVHSRQDVIDGLPLPRQANPPGYHNGRTQSRGLATNVTPDRSSRPHHRHGAVHVIEHAEGDRSQHHRADRPSALGAHDD